MTSIPRAGSLLLTLLVSCSGGQAVSSSPSSTSPERPAGAERMYVSTSSLELAPGRDTWIFVQTFVQTSPTSMTPVPPNVSFESSAPDVARVTRDSAGRARVVATGLGSSVITVRSRRDPKNVATVAVSVKEALRGDDAGLAMSAAAKFVPTAFRSAGDAPLGPMELHVEVTISNPTGAPKDIWLGGCAAWIRIYATPIDTGRPLADIPPGVQCTAGSQHVVLAPGESRTFHAEGFRAAISGDTLPNARVYVFAAVDRLRDLVNVPAGPIDVVSPNAGLVLTGSTVITGPNADTLTARLTITNTNAESVRIEYGACSLQLLAYRSPSREGTPVWNSNARFGGLIACPAYLAVGVVRPGETAFPREFNSAYAVREVLGDSLPSGRYYFKAHVRLNWRESDIRAGDAELRR